jgi:predicted transcriptional regulator
MRISKAGKAIKKLRKIKKIGQVELAQKAGMTQGNICKIEKGSKISAVDFVKVMKSMGIRLYLVKE